MATTLKPLVTIGTPELHVNVSYDRARQDVKVELFVNGLQYHPATEHFPYLLGAMRYAKAQLGQNPAESFNTQCGKVALSSKVIDKYHGLDNSVVYVLWSAHWDMAVIQRFDKHGNHIHRDDALYSTRGSARRAAGRLADGR